jgi:1,4-dihydroxy-2-naphthoate octaprenyltransferase
MIWLPFLILGFFSLFYPAAILGFLSLLLVIPATIIVATARTSQELILVLKLTSFAALAYALSLAVGLSIAFI